MATITPAAPGTSGAALNYTQATASDTLATGNKSTILMVKNDSASSVTVTVASVENCDFGFPHNQTITAAANATTPARVEPHCIDTSTGNATLTYSATTSVNVAAITG